MYVRSLLPYQFWLVLILHSTAGINYAELACLPSVNASFLSRSLNTLVSIGRIVIVDTIFVRFPFSFSSFFYSIETDAERRFNCGQLDQPTTYRSKHRLGPNLDSVIGNCSIAPGGIADGTLVRYAIIRWVEQQVRCSNNSCAPRCNAKADASFFHRRLYERTCLRDQKCSDNYFRNVSRPSATFNLYSMISSRI